MLRTRLCACALTCMEIQTIMDRRSFIASLTAALAVQTIRSSYVTGEAVSFKTNPFGLGIASGEPAADSVILWTRIVPDINAPDYGVGKAPVEVTWEIAEDAAMKKIVGSGKVAATADLNHSVHVEAKGLKPHREYFYRFHAGGATSAVGRTKTAPDMSMDVDKLRFAFASCQSYGAGYYTAHADMAKQEMDLVLFLGDYIYEHKPAMAKAGAARTWEYNSPNTIVTLEDYRRQYTMYKSDADLQAAHAVAPWVVTPDDHEVENNWAGDHSEHESKAKLIEKRTAAYRAYYENMPFRPASFPNGPRMQLYRNLPYGKLAQFSILDTRQYRTPQPCNDKPVVGCAERMADSQEMMGKEQSAWLAKTMSGSQAQWNIVGHQTLIAQFPRETPEGTIYPSDNWDGYSAARKRLTQYLAQAKPKNPVFVAGDIHRTSVNDLIADFDDPKSAVVAAELVGTSISSAGDGSFSEAAMKKMQSAHPYNKYDSHLRGYILSEITPKHMRSELRNVDKVSVKDGKVSKMATFVTENGRPGVHLA